MSVDFDGDRTPEIVQMYSAPDPSGSAYHTGINVLKFNTRSGWVLAYREAESIDPGREEITTEVVTSTDRKQGVVVIFYHSGAGTATFWHLLASVDHKIAKLDGVKMRTKALSEREYAADLGYNSVKAKGDLIIENVAGYTHHTARCCPNRPSLELSFKFTGSSFVLDSAKEVPYERPPGGIGPLLRLHENGLWGYGYQLADGFLVYGGAECPKDASPGTPPAILALRKSLVEEGAFLDAEDYLVLGGLHKFASKSEAAAVMLARPADGDREWKDENGRPVRTPREEPINLTVLGLSGIWSGFEERKGSRYPWLIRLVEQRGQSISGTVGNRTPIVNGAVNGDLLSFDVQETIYSTAHYQFTLADGRLSGEHRVGSETWPVLLARCDDPYSNSAHRTSLPILLSRVEPQYPERYSARIQEPVVLQIEIEESGRVSPDRIIVLRSIGADFDQKAIECVKQSKFQPGYVEGTPVSTSASVEIVFTP